jgi:hypothetical protein
MGTIVTSDINSDNVGAIMSVKTQLQQCSGGDGDVGNMLIHLCRRHGVGTA